MIYEKRGGTMERNRKTRPVRRRTGAMKFSPEEEERLQRLTFHACVSGILVVAVLMIAWIDTGFTNKIESSLRMAVKQDISIEEWKAIGMAGKEKIAAFGRGVMDVFKGEKDPEEEKEPMNPVDSKIKTNPDGENTDSTKKEAENASSRNRLEGSNKNISNTEETLTGDSKNQNPPEVILPVS